MLETLKQTQWTFHSSSRGQKKKMLECVLFIVLSPQSLTESFFNSVLLLRESEHEARSGWETVWISYQLSEVREGVYGGRQ